MSQADNVPLVGELALSLASTPRAPYIASRNQVTAYCQQNVIHHQGTNVLTFNLADSQAWCDPKSVAIAFDIRNVNGDQPLEFLSNDVQTLFSRLQITMAGVNVEDISHYNRLACMMHKMQSQSKILEVVSMGLDTPTKMTPSPASPDGEIDPQLWRVDDCTKPEKIPAGGKKRVVFRLTCSGTFSGSDKYLPLFCP